MKKYLGMKLKYWAVHGGSDSYFAAKNFDDANELVAMFNSIAEEYGSPQSSRVEIAHSNDIEEHNIELSKRIKVGDAEYLNP